MPVLHDYMCLAHGKFESKEALCPYGCSADMVDRVFLKPPGSTSARTRGIDRTLDQLALDFGMTDLSNQGGRAIKQAAPLSREQQALQEMLAPRWGGIQSTARDDVSAIPGAMAAYNVQPGNALDSVKHILPAPKPLPVATFGTVADIQKG